MQPSFGTISSYPQPGDVLDGKYRVEHMLGEGGMGAVARATHILRRAPVALKFMSSAVLSLHGAVERFVNEGVAASQIDSDHVVKVFDVGRLPNGAPYLVMELLDGVDLGQLLEREGPLLPVPRAVHFTLQALRALETAHAAGIVHRDMKPSNCFVIEKDGEADFVKLVDFGISKVRAADDGRAAHLTRTNSALGTPLYMSPEQARSPRDVDHRTDLYSVGAILYEMLAGRTPYSAESGEFTEILYKIFTTEPAPIDSLRVGLPEGLALVVHRALQRDPAARFASAADMAEALSSFADERSSTVLARLRSGRRSQTPRPSQTVTPAEETARATQAEATARTFASDAKGLRPASTSMGVTRETSIPNRTRPLALAGAAGAAVLVIVTLVVGALMLFGARAPVGEKAGVEAPSPAHQPSPAPTQVVLAPEADLSAPSTAASAARSADARMPSPRASVGASGAPASPARPTALPTALPTQLGDLKLH